VPAVRGLRPRPRVGGRGLLREQALVEPIDLQRCAPAARRRAIRAGRRPRTSFPRPHPPPTRPRKATSGRARRGYPRGRRDRWLLRLIVIRRRCWKRRSWRAHPGPPYRRDAEPFSALATRPSATAPRRLGAPGRGSSLGTPNSKFEIRNSKFSSRLYARMNRHGRCRPQP
jgi:hypothetical protein